MRKQARFHGADICKTVHTLYTFVMASKRRPTSLPSTFLSWSSFLFKQSYELKYAFEISSSEACSLTPSFAYKSTVQGIWLAARVRLGRRGGGVLRARVWGQALSEVVK